MKKKILLIVLVVFVLLGLIFAFAVMKGYIFNDDLTVNVISESSLREVVEISKLSTAEYTYNSTTNLYDKDKNIVKCHVKYNGTVIAGIDFSKIDYIINDDANVKKITLILPAVEVHDVIVDSGTIEYIFTDNKYDTLELPQEAYKTCIDDLETKANSNADFLVGAKENAISTIRGFVSPWVNQIDSEYVIEVR